MTRNDLKKQILAMVNKDWNGKKGYWTDSAMFKYTSFYTGNQKSALKIVKKVA